MSEIPRSEREIATAIADDLYTLGEVAVGFARVERLTMMTEDRHENDAEHSYHLGLSATEIAASYYPDLDVGLVAQFTFVHDLPELHAGDVPSYNLSEEEIIDKERNEVLAAQRLYSELPPYLASLLKRYELQEEPEARFVRMIDKLMPAINHYILPEANRPVFLNRYDINTLEELTVLSNKRTAKLAEMFPEFDVLLIVRQLIGKASREKLFEQ